MSRFYGGGTVFPQGAPATVPIIRQGAVVQPEGLPVGSIVPAAPAGFPPYQIRPETQGAYPQKQIVPPLWGNGMAASMVLPGIFSQPVNMNPTVPRGAVPLSPPAPVEAFWQTPASNAAAKAYTADARAAIAARRTVELQRKADQAAYQAGKTANQASADMTPGSAGAAAAAAMKAQQAQAHADATAHDALQRDQHAQETAYKAQIAAQKEAAAADARAQANAEKIQQADDKAMNTGTDYIWPDGQWGPPTQESDGSSGIPGMGSLALPVGGGAVAGFLAMGPLGALLGALLGGGYAYVRSSGVSSAPVVTTHPVTGSPICIDNCGGFQELPVGWTIDASGVLIDEKGVPHFPQIN